MHNRQAPNQEERSKALGKLTLAGSLALLLIASLMAFQFYSQYRLQSDQLSQVQTLLNEMRAELDGFAEQRISYESQIAGLNRELSASRDTAAALNNELALAQEQISPDLSRIEQQIRQRVIREVESQQQNDLPTRTRLLQQLASLEREELAEIMSLQSIYGGFLQALDVSDERMEEIVDALTSQIAENNRARREIIEENVGNPEGRRSIRRELFALDSPSAQREAVSYFLDETELAVFDSFQEERQQQRQMSRTGFFGSPGSRAGTVMFNESVTTGPDGQIETQIIELVVPDDPSPN
jgi:chromosome segregation ATPase